MRILLINVDSAWNMAIRWKLKFYIYHHPDMDLGQTLRRIEWCRAHKSLPYLMRDRACWDCEQADFITDLAAYCNQPQFFKKLTFSQFLEKRHKNPDRISTSRSIWCKAEEAASK